jgi:hypothetical protein
LEREPGKGLKTMERYTKATAGRNSSKAVHRRIVYVATIGNRARRIGLRPFLTRVFRVERTVLGAA